MYGPPSDPRDRPPFNHPSWRNVLTGYGLFVAFVVSLWVVTNPLIGAAVLTTVVGLSIGARPAYRLARCLSDCPEITFDLSETVRITITRTPIDDPQ